MSRVARSPGVGLFAMLAIAALVGAIMPTIEAGAADPVLVGAGDIANCDRTEDEATATLLDSISGTVFTLGDNVYPNGTADEFADCYGPTWGRHLARTKPVSGNHDYDTSGAAGYYGYFGAVAAPPRGYYAYDLGAWRVVVLNSECGKVPGGCGAGSPQERWLEADLDAHAASNVIAMWHRPRFTSQGAGGNTALTALWDTLYDHGADLILTGHTHNYERFAPMRADGTLDTAHGIPSIIVGTGGADSAPPISRRAPNSLRLFNDAYGVLKLTLHATTFDWEFVPIQGQSFADSGTGAVHDAPPAGNGPPVAKGDSLVVRRNGSLGVDLGASDPDGDPLTYAIVSQPEHGALTGSGAARTYTPEAGFRGDDAFSFRVSDGTTTSAAARVRLTVAGVVPVRVGASSLSPKNRRAPQGARVRWSFSAGGRHRIFDDAGLGLFDSGIRASGSSYAAAFPLAGGFTYACRRHPSMAGRVRVPLKVTPTSTAAFEVTWASARLGGAYRHDVQVRPPSGAWATWRDGVKALSGTFVPDGGAGRYRFRARVTRAWNGGVSGWSPVSVVRVQSSS